MNAGLLVVIECFFPTVVLLLLFVPLRMISNYKCIICIKCSHTCKNSSRVDFTQIIIITIRRRRKRIPMWWTCLGLVGCYVCHQITIAIGVQFIPIVTIYVSSIMPHPAVAFSPCIKAKPGIIWLHLHFFGIWSLLEVGQVNVSWSIWKEI